MKGGERKIRIRHKRGKKGGEKKRKGANNNNKKNKSIPATEAFDCFTHAT